MDEKEYQKKTPTIKAYEEYMAEKCPDYTATIVHRKLYIVNFICVSVQKLKHLRIHS